MTAPSTELLVESEAELDPEPVAGGVDASAGPSRPADGAQHDREGGSIGPVTGASRDGGVTGRGRHGTGA